jgi:flavin-dependent dehydrogenase
MIGSLMNIKTDVLVIGGGPGGAAAAMFLTREGIKPIVLEQETFPRFHIGESMTGDYEHEDDYSIPVGSRFHPERAAMGT